jgi:glycerol-3-phosphate cytidylyltransferase
MSLFHTRPTLYRTPTPRHPTTGYMTMTCDLMHQGHLNILQTAKSMCGHLIIGLTTDSLAQQQKRKTFFSFEHRAALLRACRYVDAVIEHNGNTKQVDYGRLKFDMLFTGDDYANSAEYTEFEAENNSVRVIYLPRTAWVSTSSIIADFRSRIIADLQVSPYSSINDDNILTATCNIPGPMLIECYLYNSRLSNMHTINSGDVKSIGIEQLAIITPDPFSHLILKLFIIDNTLGKSSLQYVCPATYINGGEWIPRDNHDQKIQTSMNMDTPCSQMTTGRLENGNIISIWRLSSTERLPLSLVDVLVHVGVSTRERIMGALRKCVMDYSAKGILHGYLHPDNIRFSTPPIIDKPVICGWENASRTSQRYTQSHDQPDWVQLTDYLSVILQ